jgi:hypothetical protein
MKYIAVCLARYFKNKHGRHMKKVCLEDVKTYDVLDRVYKYGTQ